MLRYGFFNSVNGDRTYDAEDMGRLFDGIIQDGVFYACGERFFVHPTDSSSMVITVETGRAWFNGTWTDLDAPLQFEVPTSTIQRSYYLTLVVDKRTSAEYRRNFINLLTGNQLIDYQNTANVYPYRLATINVPANATVIHSENIVNHVGGDEEPIIPYVISPVQSIDLGPQIEYWETQMNAAIDAAIDAYFNGLTVATKPADLGQGYGVCNTASNTLAKTVSISDFQLTDGGIVAIKFVNAVPAGSTLNINGTGAKYIHYKNSLITGNEITDNNVLVTFVYDATSNVYRILAIDNEDIGFIDPVKCGLGYFVCSTAASTAEKAINRSDYILSDCSILVIKFLYAVPANATLSVNSGTARSIYFQGTNITANVIKAGSIATLSYDDSNHVFNVISIDGETFNPTPIQCGLYYFVCDTAESTVIKTINGGDFNLTKGAILVTKFTYAVPASSTLKVERSNGIAYYGAIKYMGSDIVANVIKAGNTATFSFDGMYFHVISVDELPSSSGGSSSPFIVNITNNGSTLSADKSESEILAAVSNNQVVLAKTPNGMGYYSNDDDGAEFIVSVGTSSTRASHRYVIDGSTVTASSFSEYTKPSGGIPETDLATAVKNKLPFYVTITYDSGFTSDKTFAEVSAAYTAGQPIEVLCDYMMGWLATITASAAQFYAIDANGATLYIFELTSSGGYSVTVSQRDLGSPTETAVSGSTPSITAADNTIYTCGEVSSLTITAAANIDFTVIFTSGSTATTLTMDQRITMPDGFTVEADKRYEINVSNGYAVVAGWAVSASA